MVVSVFSSMSDDDLYRLLQSLYASYETASWSDIEALGESGAAIRAEMGRRYHVKSVIQCAAAGLPKSFAYPG